MIRLVEFGEQMNQIGNAEIQDVFELELIAWKVSEITECVDLIKINHKDLVEEASEYKVKIVENA